MQAGPLRLGRYTLYTEIASGGMASVYLGQLSGDAGFSRIVAIKRMHKHLAEDDGLVSMFVDEARLAARIVHPNVVQTLDVVSSDGELFLVMEYVQGETLAQIARSLRRRNDPRFPVPIASAVVCGALAGLHAAHTAVDEAGQPLGVVHRDVSPQNIILGVDGVPRVLDFGVAKARVRAQSTAQGQIKGKLAYMAPEQLGGEVSVATDIYAAGIVLWELLAGERLFPAETEMQLIERVLYGTISPPGEVNPHVTAALDAVVMRALSRDVAARFPSALEMSRALEAAARPAATADVAAWVGRVAGERIAKMRQQVADIESGVRSLPPIGRPPASTPGWPAPAPPPSTPLPAMDQPTAFGHSLARSRSSIGWPIPATLAALALCGTVGLIAHWTSGAPRATAAAPTAAPSAEPANTTEAPLAAPVPAPPPSASVTTSSAPEPPPSAAATASAKPRTVRVPVHKMKSPDDLGSLIDSRR